MRPLTICVVRFSGRISPIGPFHTGAGASWVWGRDGSGASRSVLRPLISCSSGLRTLLARLEQPAKTVHIPTLQISTCSKERHGEVWGRRGLSGRASDSDEARTVPVVNKWDSDEVGVIRALVCLNAGAAVLPLKQAARVRCGRRTCRPQSRGGGMLDGLHSGCTCAAVGMQELPQAEASEEEAMLPADGLRSNRPFSPFFRHTSALVYSFRHDSLRQGQCRLVRAVEDYAWGL